MHFQVCIARNDPSKSHLRPRYLQINCKWTDSLNINFITISIEGQLFKWACVLQVICMPPLWERISVKHWYSVVLNILALRFSVSRKSFSQKSQVIYSLGQKLIRLYNLASWKLVSFQAIPLSLSICLFLEVLFLRFRSGINETQNESVATKQRGGGSGAEGWLWRVCPSLLSWTWSNFPSLRDLQHITVCASWNV